jgi:anaerobic magnesium-protoporphyrin IX monomethyl ester cyclase
MKVLFIIPPWIPGSHPVPDFGENGRRYTGSYAAYLLGSVLSRANFFVKILDLSSDNFYDPGKILSCSGNVDAVCITVDSLRWEISKEIINLIKTEHGDIPLVAGGIHSTLFDEYILLNHPVDFIVRNEGEKTLPALLKWIGERKGEVEDIPGISLVKQGAFVRTPDAKLLTDKEFEQLPFPLLEEMPGGVFDAILLETSRGNPFYSPFIVLPYIKTWRSLSPVGIFERAYRIQEHYFDKVREESIVLTDEYFTAGEKRVHDFRKIYEKKNARFKLEFTTRCTDLLEESLLEDLMPFTKRISVEIHAGYDRGLSILKSGFSINTIKDTAAKLEKFGLASITTFIFTVGFPWEDNVDMEKTTGFAGSLQELFGVEIQVRKFLNLPGNLY